MGCGSSSSKKKRNGNSNGDDSERQDNNGEDGTPNNKKDSKREHSKSLSTYNKTKGGSMLFNLSSRSHMDPDNVEFTDDQHIMSPSEPDWKVGKPLRRAPLMKKTHYQPIFYRSDLNKRVMTAIGYTTLQGKNPKPPHKPNQDSLSIFIVDGHPNLAAFCVFDGHGPFGEHASHYCRSYFHQAMLKNSKEVLETNPKLALETAILDVHARFCSEATAKGGVDPVVSGTTFIGVLFDGNRIYTANVGDSRAIMGSLQDDHKMVVTELSDDHKPQRPDERERIEQTNAILLTEREVRGFGDDSKMYVCREKGGDIIYGVLFTRSVGDLDAHENLGISAKPEIDVRDLTEKDQFLILASDGVWDYMTNEEVLDIAVNKRDPLKASEEIVKIASQRWEERDQDARRDDITVLVLRVELLSKQVADEKVAELEKDANGDAS